MLLLDSFFISGKEEQILSPHKKKQTIHMKKISYFFLKIMKKTNISIYIVGDVLFM